MNNQKKIIDELMKEVGVIVEKGDNENKKKINILFIVMVFYFVVDSLFLLVS